MTSTFRRTLVAATAVAASACASAGSAPPEATDGPPPAQAPADAGGPRIVQPGAPGEASRTYTGAGLDEIEGAAYTEADIRFMRGMIHHHAQALQMTALVTERTTSEGFRRMALRMEISQTDEIAMMVSWLRQRGEDVPHVGAHGVVHGGSMMMPGMLSAEQMEQLRGARGDEFERLFLELMIQHHQGAITMVHELFDTPGAAQESTINFFANEVDADQTIEIQRMRQMLEERG